MNEKLEVSMFSLWQMFLITVFDVDLTSEKFVPSKDPEVRALGISIPRYSLFQMFKMTLLDTDD